MTGDPALQITELGPPIVGHPVDPNDEVLGPPDLQAWDVAGAAPQQAARATRRWNFGPRSLTGRLVTGVVALVVVLVLVTGLGTYFALRSFLMNRLDQQLQGTASGSVLFRLFERPAGSNQAAPVHAPQEVWAVLLSTDGAVLANPVGTTMAVDALSLDLADSGRLAARSSQEPESVTTTDGQHLRVTVRHLTVTFAGALEAVPATAVVGLSTSEVDRTLHRLIVLEWVIGSAAVLMAFAATAGGVRLSLRRLRRVTATAQEVAAELSPEGAGLDRRVPVDETGTEVGQLAESMNTLLSAVETQFAARLESEQRMRQFLADASHELRTPLTSIRGYAELARMRREHGQGEVDPANLDRIEAEGTRMSRLIDDLLLLARSDQANDADAAQVRQLVDVDALLDDVVSGARAACPGREIHLSVPTGLTLIGDSDQLVRAIRNLVTNAATHTRPDGPIGVRADREGGSIVIQVSDSGPGLPPEQAAHVFERFWRADKARTRARGGSGLGMSIVTSIVGSHGGTVRFDSDVRTGSTVTVRLPAGLG